MAAAAFSSSGVTVSFDNKLKKASILAKKSYEERLINDYCANKRFIVDKPRKQATNINHLMELLKDYFYKFYGIDLSFISISELKELQNDNIPLKTKRRKSERNTISLDI